MLMLRFQRTGRRNIPTYRLVATEKSSPSKSGKVTEYLGHYLPAREPHVFEFKRERVEHWLKVGAQPSDTAARLLTRAGVKGLEKFIDRYTKRKKKGEPTSLSEGELHGPRATVKEAKEEASPKGAELGDKEKKAE